MMLIHVQLFIIIIFICTNFLITSQYPSTPQALLQSHNVLQLVPTAHSVTTYAYHYRMIKIWCMNLYTVMAWTASSKSVRKPTRIIRTTYLEVSLTSCFTFMRVANLWLQ